jgi:hypothetical protein
MHDFDTLAARYVATWNQTDPAERRVTLQRAWADDARYIDPLADAAGREAIDATIAAAQSTFPSWEFRLVGPVDGHHNQCRFGWELGPQGGDAPVAGFDVAEFDDDGRLLTVFGFLDRVPAPADTSAAPSPA